jgi:glutamate carboxypeptidase
MPIALSKSSLLALHAHFVKHRGEILSLTRTLVETESSSGDEAGSKAVVGLLAAAASTIGAITSIERIPSENAGEHLRIRAFSSDENSSPRIVILGHTDTVWPSGTLHERPWREEGNRIYGPGIFDMKANCVLALEALRACDSAGTRPKSQVTLLLTCDEENGSPAGRGLVEAEARGAHAVLVIEPSATGGGVKTARKGTAMFTIEARGRAAHAGLEPEKGISAILELSRQVVQLETMSAPEKGTTVTVCMIRGGTHSNVVPAEARAEVDVRFSSAEEGRRLESEILRLRPFDSRAQLIVRGGINRPPLERNEKVKSLYQHARQIAALLDFELSEASVGGASDGNFAAAMGVPVLDGLGIDGGGAHAEHEHILVDDIPRRGALLAGLIASL